MSTSGRPLRATLCLTTETQRSDASPCLQTNPQGAFSLQLAEGGSYLLSADAPGHLPASRELRVGQGVVDLSFTLEPGGVELEGTALDAKGGGVPGAFLSVTGIGSAGKWSRGIADSHGRFLLSVPAGNAQVTASAPGYADATSDVVAPAQGLVLVLAPGSMLVGRVVMMGSDSGVSGALVTATARNAFPFKEASARTADDGTFHIASVTPGSYDLEASAENLRSERRSARVDPASQSESITLVMLPATRVAATLLSGDKPCVEGAAILSGRSVLDAQTRDAGELLFPAVPAGHYVVRAVCAEAPPKQFDLVVPERGDMHETWRLDDGHELRGRVTTASGIGAEGVVVQLTTVDAKTGTFVHLAPNCVSSTGGDFRCRGLAAGPYQCSAGGTGPVPASNVVNVNIPADAPIRIELAGAGTIRAILNKSVAAASVVAKGRDGLSWPGENAGANTFVVRRVPLGAYDVGLSGSRDSVRIQIERDGQVVEAHLRVATEALTGRVLDATSQPVVEAWVQARANGEWGAGFQAPPALTDDRGEFTVPNLAPGTYSLVISSTLGEAKVDDAHTGQHQRIELKGYP